MKIFFESILRFVEGFLWMVSFALEEGEDDIFGMVD